MNSTIPSGVLSPLKSIDLSPLNNFIVIPSNYEMPVNDYAIFDNVLLKSEEQLDNTQDDEILESIKRNCEN